MEEKIKELVEDQEFVKKLLSCEEPEQVQKLFADNGVEISLEDVKALGKALAAMAESDGELSEDDLEAVAGGSAWDTIRKILAIDILGRPVIDAWKGLKSFFSRW